MGSRKNKKKYAYMYTCTCICAPMCVCVCAKSLQSCLTLYNPMDCSLPGSSVHGFLQESTGLGCPFLRQGMFLTQGSNPHLLCLLHWHVSSLPLAPSGKLHVCTRVCVCVCVCVKQTEGQQMLSHPHSYLPLEFASSQYSEEK